MRPLKRAASAPALFLTVAVLGAVAVVLALTSVGTSSAAPARPRTSAVAVESATPSPVAPASHAASPSAAKHHAGDTPGQEYLGDTAARRGEMVHAYDACLLSHGARVDHTAAMAPYAGHHRAVAIATPIPTKATRSCTDLRMKEPKPLNPRLNPHYHADAAANVACLRAHGMAVHLVTSADKDVPSGLLWTFDSSTTKTPAHENKIETSCLLKTFGH